MPDPTFFPLLDIDHHFTPSYPFDDQQYQSYSSHYNTFLGFDHDDDGDDDDDDHHQHNHHNNNNSSSSRMYGVGFDDDHGCDYYPLQNSNIISTDHNKAEYSISSFSASAPLLLDQTPVTTTTTTITSHRHHDMASGSSGSSASASSVDCMSMNRYHMKMKCKEGIKETKRREENVVVFRTMTGLETLDDGYKWRKYGKKMVKSNPNPRNYYKCTSVGCRVKKRIERDSEDSRYLRTTYEGIHNHQSPCGIIYQYDQLPSSLSHAHGCLQPKYQY